MRKSAGPMKSKRKWDEDEEKSTEDWLEEADEDKVYPEEIDAEYCESMDPEEFYGGPCWCSKQKDKK